MHSASLTPAGTTSKHQSLKKQYITFSISDDKVKYIWPKTKPKNWWDLPHIFNNNIKSYFSSLLGLTTASSAQWSTVGKPRIKNDSRLGPKFFLIDHMVWTKDGSFSFIYYKHGCNLGHGQWSIVNGPDRLIYIYSYVRLYIYKKL